MQRERSRGEPVEREPAGTSDERREGGGGRRGARARLVSGRAAGEGTLAVVRVLGLVKLLLEGLRKKGAAPTL